MLRTEIDKERATFVIDDPDRRNPLTADIIEGLIAGLADLPRDVRVVVITGAGDKAFCAGGDLGGGFFDDPIGTHRARGRLGDLFEALRSDDRPVIARVNGHALAGGFGLMLACDMAVAVETATFGTPEVGVGLFPMMITTVIQRSLPPKAAFELMMTGRRMDAAEAHRLGALTRVVPTDALDEVLDEMVDGLVGISAAGLAMGKHAFYSVQDGAFSAALDHLAVGITQIAMTDDAAEGLAAFVGKRTPDFKGR